MCHFGLKYFKHFLINLVNIGKPGRKPQYNLEKIYVAIYDYEARTDEDLTFHKGDLLKIIDDRFVSVHL